MLALIWAYAGVIGSPLPEPESVALPAGPSGDETPDSDATDNTDIEES